MVPSMPGPPAFEAAPPGLTGAAAAAALARCGPNTLGTHRRERLVLDFLARFRNPLVLVLLGASAVSAFLGDMRSLAVIGTIVLVSVTLDFVQELRAGRAAERLRGAVALRAHVLRDGVARDMAADGIVPGDVVHLAAGDLVPADGRVVAARDFFVNQSFLTGESFPVEKHAGPAQMRAEAGADDPCAIFTGTSVISGSATMVVTATGRATAIGRIGGTLDRRPPPTAFALGMAAFGNLILRATLVLVVFVLVVNAAFHRPVLDSFLFAVALAVGLTPELLPMILSVTLARGALRLAERRVIVKRLSAVQDLGTIDVLCTDKTGTLTEGRIRLERHVDPQGRESGRVLALAWLNSTFESGLRSPLDDAILAHEHLDLDGWTKVDEVPFDFERRRVSVLAERAGERVLVVKGAPEDVLALCTRCEADAASPAAAPRIVHPAECAVVPLDAPLRAAIDARFAALGDAGYRALAVAWRAVPPDHPHAVLTDETELVFAGFVAFLDPPKASARAALAGLARHGIAVKIVSGDNERVTRHLCEALGIHVTGLVTGAELHGLDLPTIAARVEQANVFCRVNPAQKARVLAALKSRGHVVGFLGDGINDAPSLHAADCGISVDGAVDVAKEAADLVLMEQDLGVLLDGVREGRRTFANVMKYVTMGTSSNFGNMASMAAATLVLPFLPMLPLQILLNNLLYDVSELALPFDHVDEAMLALPARWDMAPIRRTMLVLGPVSSAFDLATFAVLAGLFQAGEALFHTGWFVESLATQALVVFLIRTPGNPFASRPHPALAILAPTVVAVAAALPYTPLAPLLGFVPLPPAVAAAIAAIVVAYLLAVEIAKRFVPVSAALRTAPSASRGPSGS